MAKGLKIVLPSAVSDPEGKLRKLEHYYGIEFTRGASNGGGATGYYRLIGDDSLRSEMRFHNQIKLANVKDGVVQFIYNQTNLNLDENGNAVTFNGADGSDVMQIHTKTVYAVIGGSNPTYERFIVSDAPFTYDGDVAIEFDPYGECPDYMTVDANNKARSIYGTSGIGSFGAGAAYDFTYPGETGATATDYRAAAGFPRTSTSRWGFEGFSRAKNSNASGNIPYTIVSNLDIELAFAFLAIECRTKVLTNVFGNGISANAAPDANTWGTVTGVKITTPSGTTYGTFGTPLTTSGGTSQAMWAIINGYNPLTQILEAQKAVSDGATLTPVSDTDGNVIGAGTMTGIYTKNFSFKVALTGDTIATVDVCLRIPMWRGRNRMQGNLTQWYGGYECVTTRADESSPVLYDIYRATSIESLATDTVYSVSGTEKFGFENTYQKVGTVSLPSVGVGFYAQQMMTVSGVTTAIGDYSKGTAAGRENYEAAYVYFSGPDQVGTNKYRKGSLFGSLAADVYAVLRFAYLHYAPSIAYTAFGSAFRVTLQ